ncbi:MAG: DUF6475 domain-containing protein [Fusobacterium sp.]|uniref:DUF6475 domain-containing protein n=1 Tax=Fusobacterium sp. TaxID=68766 RepID=UPI002A75A1B7|nr:DUF6475 domain-containing protein [Fusobacterium sp.]MDY3058879.1 DUF6475 domain-containing protein [Fusobacterium sp.]
MREEIFWEGIGMIEIVTNKQFTDNQAKAYKLLLDDIPEDKFVNGINIMLRERVFSNLPMPADIRKYCLETREEDLEIRVFQARNKILKAISSVGTYTTVAFDDPIIHLIIRDFGGWIKLGMKDMEELENLLKWEFPKLYKAYAGRKNIDIPLMLEGRSDDKTVKYIGDKERALKWITVYQAKTEQLEDKKQIKGVIEDLRKIRTA